MTHTSLPVEAPPRATSQQAQALADRLEAGARALATFAATLTDAEWLTPVPHDGHTVGVVVHHVASVYPVEIELAHQDIRLRQTGVSIVNDSLFLNGWSMCGQDYHVLQTTVVEDVLRLPPHSVRQPEFIGVCTRDGKPERWSVVAVLDNPTSFRQGMMPRSPIDTLPYPAIAAWHLDEIAKRFVPIEPRGLRCPRWGIITRDAGM